MLGEICVCVLPSEFSAESAGADAVASLAGPPLSELATEPKRLSQGRASLGIGGGRQRMIAPQPPPPQVFIAAQAVAGADMPSQRLSPVAAIETNHIVPMHGSSHRHSRSQNLFWLGRLSKLTDRPMNRGNQV